MSFCAFEGCTRAPTAGSQYCRFCQRKGSIKDYGAQAHLHKQAVVARHNEAFSPEPWKLLREFCAPRETRGSNTYTYAIGLHRYVKFGQAGSLEGRLMDLQIANPRRLRVLGYIGSSRELEHHIHDALRAHAVRGEWFRLNDVTRDLIRLMRANDLAGLCQRISVLITEKDTRELLDDARMRLVTAEIGPVLV